MWANPDDVVIAERYDTDFVSCSVLQRLQDRLDAVLDHLAVHELHLQRRVYLVGRSSSAAKKDAADFRI